MKLKHCRWGILGTANIARKNWQSIHDAGNALLVAVASREKKRAARFIAECQKQIPFPNPPEALGSYEELISHSGIDALYLPLPTGLRKEWAIRAAEAGKHILVEKPIGITSAEAEAIVAACKHNGVQFMDGTMFAHGKRLKHMGETLRSAKTVGEIRRISSQFSFGGDKKFLRSNIRTHPELEPLGCLGDLGWYSIYFSLWAMGGQLPLQVTGRIHKEARQSARLAAVPIEFSGELLFEDGITASYFCSFIAENAQWAVVSGTRGYLQLPDFVLPYTGSKTSYSVVQTEFTSDGCQFDMRPGCRTVALEEPSSNAPGSQESNLFRTMSRLALGGKLDPYWPDFSLKVQRVATTCLESARQNSIWLPISPR